MQKYDFIDLFPVNPSKLARYREAVQPSKAKDDWTDRAACDGYAAAPSKALSRCSSPSALKQHEKSWDIYARSPKIKKTFLPPQN